MTDPPEAIWALVAAIVAVYSAASDAPLWHAVGLGVGACAAVSVNILTDGLNRGPDVLSK